MADPNRSIPTKSREIINDRDRHTCVRCACPGREWHHRRSRSVRGPHRHCPCNGVLLCGECHKWVHRNPTEAMEAGLIVSRWEDDPWAVPVTTVYGVTFQTCDGLREQCPSRPNPVE